MKLNRKIRRKFIKKLALDPGQFNLPDAYDMLPPIEVKTPSGMSKDQFNKLIESTVEATMEKAVEELLTSLDKEFA